jgi:hypothetical protein
MDEVFVMGQRLFLFILVLVLALIACSAEETATETTPQDTAAPVEPESVGEPAGLTPTSEPPTVMPATAEPTLTVEPATAVPTPTIQAEADEVTAESAGVPDLVWLPYGSGSYGNPVLTLQQGQIVYEEEPAAIEAFFDYADGRIAYGAEFWYAAANGTDAVTDLWVYDYATGQSEQWLAGEVARAEWSPVDTEVLAVALHNGSAFDLVLMSGPIEWTVLNEDINPFYAWSPDGEQIAFVRDGDLIVTTLDGSESESEPLASGVYQESGWVGDAPLWLPDEGLLAYADFPVTFVSLNGAEQYEPIGVNGEVMDVNKRPFQMLWSASQQQLIMQYQAMFGSAVQIFQFADDIRTVTEVFDLGEGTEIADWYERDESIIILQNGEPQIYSLLTHDYMVP